MAEISLLIGISQAFGHAMYFEQKPSVSIVFVQSEG